MDIRFHATHVDVSDNMQRKATRLIQKAAQRAGRATAATVRFEEDGKLRRVHITLASQPHGRLATTVEGRHFGPLLEQALDSLLSQARKERRNPHARARQRARKDARA